jgi:hypothetical protein
VGLLIWNPENKEACEAYLETSVFNSKFCVGRGGCVTAMVFTGIILSCHFEILRTSVHILVDCSLFGILLVPFMVSQMLTFLLFATNLCRIFLLLMTSRLTVVLVRIAVKCVSCCILMTTTQWNHPKPSTLPFSNHDRMESNNLVLGFADSKTKNVIRLDSSGRGNYNEQDCGGTNGECAVPLNSFGQGMRMLATCLCRSAFWVLR